MPTRDYKTYIIIFLLVVIAGFIVYFFITRSSYNSDPGFKSVERAAPRSAPLIEQDTAEIDKVIPIEELGVGTQKPEELARLGDKYFEGGNYGQAVEIYKRVLELNPRDIDTHNDLGLAYYYTRRPTLAIDTLRKGTEVNPSYQRIWLSLGFILMSTGLSDEARPAFQKAIELNPENDVGIEARKMLENINK